MSSFEPRYYEMAREEGDWSSFPRREVLEYLRSVSQDGKHILEVGCGTGEILQFLPSAVSYTGVEKSRYGIEEARKKWGNTFPGANFLVGEAENLPLGEARFDPAPFVGDIEERIAQPTKGAGFDVVLLLFVIEHVMHPRQVLGECARVLKKGGSLIVLSPNLELPFSRPSALRHKSILWRMGFLLTRLIDYVLRIFGIFTFRTIKENFVDATGRYEKKDDDLRYVASSYEIIKELERLGLRIERFWEEKELSGLPRILRYLPALRWYGVTLAAAFTEKS